MLLHAEHAASGTGLGMCVEMLRRGAALCGSWNERENEQGYNPPGTYAVVNWNSEVRVDSAEQGFKSRHQTLFKGILGQQESKTRLWRKPELSQVCSVILAATGQVTAPVFSFLMGRCSMRNSEDYGRTAPECTQHSGVLGADAVRVCGHGAAL